MESLTPFPVDNNDNRRGKICYYVKGKPRWKKSRMGAVNIKKPAEKGSQIFKYIKARARGLSKINACIASGQKGSKEVITARAYQIEKSKTYEVTNALYQKNLLGLELIAIEHNKNISQDSDKGAKNMAIKMALDVYDVFPKDRDEIEPGDLKVTFLKKGLK